MESFLGQQGGSFGTYAFKRGQRLGQFLNLLEGRFPFNHHEIVLWDKEGPNLSTRGCRPDRQNDIRPGFSACNGLFP